MRNVDIEQSRAVIKTVDVLIQRIDDVVSAVSGVINAVPEIADAVEHRDAHLFQLVISSVVVSEIFHRLLPKYMLKIKTRTKGRGKSSPRNAIVRGIEIVA